MTMMMIGLLSRSLTNARWQAFLIVALLVVLTTATNDANHAIERQRDLRRYKKSSDSKGSKGSKRDETLCIPLSPTPAPTKGKGGKGSSKGRRRQLLQDEEGPQEWHHRQLKSSKSGKSKSKGSKGSSTEAPSFFCSEAPSLAPSAAPAPVEICYTVDSQTNSLAATQAIPIVTASDVATFYNCQGPCPGNSVAGIETPPNTITSFLLEDNTGTLSLVVIAGSVAAGSSAGSATIVVSGVEAPTVPEFNPAQDQFLYEPNPTGTGGTATLITTWGAESTDGFVSPVNLPNVGDCAAVTVLEPTGIADGILFKVDGQTVDADTITTDPNDAGSVVINPAGAASPIFTIDVCAVDCATI